MSNAERRTLKMHPQLLWSVIHRQAGTIGKGILEGVMNSVDAGATRCDITFDRDHFAIEDDGKGFMSDQEIEDFFETFGTPHEEGDATYGRFRMGRGQMMAFGMNVWHTNNYKMVVDLKPQKDELGKDTALGYDFYKVDEHTPGCKIDVQLYDKLTPSGLDTLTREVQEYVKYVPIPVTLNGKVISQDPATLEWDLETEDAYIKFKGSGTLDIYNLGVLVAKQSQYLAGVSGVVVSKNALEVNFARNAVQDSCKIWRGIKKLLKDRNSDDLKRNKPLNESQRDVFGRDLNSGELSLKELGSARIVTDITNSHHSFNIFNRLNSFSDTISIAKRGDRVAEMAHTRKVAFVVSEEFAERLGASNAEELKTAIRRIFKNNNQDIPKFKAVDRAYFDTVISSRHEPIKDTELNKAERFALKAIRAGALVLYRNGGYVDRRNQTDVFLKGHDYGARKISVGASDTAQAWTDGTRNIWIERKKLKLIKDGFQGAYTLASLLLHEYLHNEPSTDTHEHGVEFYERFHNIALNSYVLGEAADEILRTILKDLRKDNQRVVNNLLNFENNIAMISENGLSQYESYEQFMEPTPESESSPDPIIAPELVTSAATPVNKKKEKENSRQLSFSI